MAKMSMGEGVSLIGGMAGIVKETLRLIKNEHAVKRAENEVDKMQRAYLNENKMKELFVTKNVELNNRLKKKEERIDKLEAENATLLNIVDMKDEKIKELEAIIKDIKEKRT